MTGDEHQNAPTDVSGDVKDLDGQLSEDGGRKARKRTQKKVPSEKPVTRQIRRHTPSERAEKIRRIEDSLAKDGLSLKAAVEAVGISDQTYYQWKRAEKPSDVSSTPSASSGPSVSSPSATPPASVGSELAELIKLEEENQRLRQLLGEKLRAENAELRRRLELD
ncbi:transposase [Rhizobium sp. 9140]|uniref:transposase n=1 Tax=Rhizobium sp. 9140 TaxID=1761900 RepID=UPI00079C84C5|nr:transposase [Rhizobium sp. 9140]CZT36559.1 putative transposase [Rhizobium sp. 9140]